jgi:hypothetical protein
MLDHGSFQTDDTLAREHNIRDSFNFDDSYGKLNQRESINPITGERSPARPGSPERLFSPSVSGKRRMVIPSSPPRKSLVQL